MSPPDKDDERKAVTRHEVRLVWFVVATVAGIVVIALVPVGAYFRLDSKVTEIDRRMSVMETKQEGSEKMLRGIENSVSRIEGRLGITAPEAAAPK